MRQQGTTRPSVEERFWSKVDTQHAKQAHCKYGHLLEGENLRRYQMGNARLCLACHNARTREDNARRRAERREERGFRFILVPCPVCGREVRPCNLPRHEASHRGEEAA